MIDDTQHNMIDLTGNLFSECSFQIGRKQAYTPVQRFDDQDG